MTRALQLSVCKQAWAFAQETGVPPRVGPFAHATTFGSLVFGTGEMPTNPAAGRPPPGVVGDRHLESAFVQRRRLSSRRSTDPAPRSAISSNSFRSTSCRRPGAGHPKIVAPLRIRITKWNFPGLFRADAGTRTPDPFITSRAFVGLFPVFPGSQVLSDGLKSGHICGVRDNVRDKIQGDLGSFRAFKKPLVADFWQTEPITTPSLR